jgi:hypothetical protein
VLDDAGVRSVDEDNASRLTPQPHQSEER